MVKHPTKNKPLININDTTNILTSSAYKSLVACQHTVHPYTVSHFLFLLFRIKRLDSTTKHNELIQKLFAASLLNSFPQLMYYMNVAWCLIYVLLLQHYFIHDNIFRPHIMGNANPFHTAHIMFSLILIKRICGLAVCPSVTPFYTFNWWCAAQTYSV